MDPILRVDPFEFIDRTEQVTKSALRPHLAHRNELVSPSGIRHCLK